ncbi:MAG TPA: ATP-binding protein [Polyangiaceae bacterium]|jgi:signal transduction histidine kinase/ActR/RegA family two-component response regulator|nr:ATP-binding protein [Polyangiaceae bacterium]
MSIRRNVLRYLTGAGLVGFAAAARYLLERQFGDMGTFAFFYAAVLIAAYVGGLGPGIVATGLGAAAVGLVFSDGPLGPQTAVAGVLRHAIFLGTGVVMSWLIEARRRSEDRAEMALEDLSRERERARGAVKEAEIERQKLLDGERAARAEAEQMVRTKDEFLATLSHELRTPLNAILGWAQLLRAGKMTPKDASRGLEVIERNARAQARLVEDLLDMSRIISGTARLDVKRVDFGSVVDTALESVRAAAQAKSIRLTKSVDASVSRATGDRARLQQILWNLLSNAIKFTPNGGSVEVALKAAGDAVEISVSDTGQGIAPEFMPHVFERFRQADSSVTRIHSGLGLGLAIARHLTELHGGTIRAESEGTGRGAVFTVRLPGGAEPLRDRAPMSEGAPSTDRTSAVVAYTPPPLDGVRVLFVDDDQDSRELGVHILAEHKAEVFPAGSAREALDVLKRERPTVLVSDIGMPGEDGYELIGKVRQLGDDGGGGTPAVALTAFAHPDDRRRALLAGFQVHLPKPVDPVELVAAVAALAGRTGRMSRPRSA